MALTRLFRHRSARSVALLAAGACVLAGCNGHRGTALRNDPLRSDPQMTRQQADLRSTVQPVDQSGAVQLDDTQLPPKPAPVAATPPDGGTRRPDEISPTVESVVRPAHEDAAATAGHSTAPAGAPAGPRPAAPRNPGDAPDTTGGYQLIGTVLAEVHDAPIFADKVLASIDKALAAQAVRLDERQFRAAAAELIDKEVERSINDELEFAMAKRRLDPRDQELARLATIRWVDEQVTKSGGSIEIARQRATASGYDFDELKDERFRWFMRMLYYEKREYPKIQVTAADMRHYYQENLQREFTTSARARFRVIKLDARARGHDEALAEANRLLERARGGADFATLAAEENDQESFKAPVEWFQRGSFVVKEVEDAVWKLEPGQLTGVIEAQGAFYIAKLEAKQEGGVRPFGDQRVQDAIESALKKRQLTDLQRKVQQQLMADAIIRYHPRMIELAVDMAMQKYHYWRTAAAAH